MPDKTSFLAYLILAVNCITFDGQLNKDLSLDQALGKPARTSVVLLQRQRC